MFWAPLFSPSASADTIALAKRTALRQSTEDVLRGVTVFHTRPDRSDALSRLTCPVIMISGAEDVAPDPGATRAQARRAKAGVVHIITACGHYVPLERPDELNAILRGVIAAADTSSSPHLDDLKEKVVPALGSRV
jgi:pimeloyl-ACP methyl ester carboxylesterase